MLELQTIYAEDSGNIVEKIDSGIEKDIERCFVVKRQATEKDELDFCHALALLLGPLNVKGSCYMSEKEDSLKKVCLQLTNRCYKCMADGYRGQNHFCQPQRTCDVWPSELNVEHHSFEISALICK